MLLPLGVWRSGEAFDRHETSGRHEPETVEKWRAALKQVANKSGLISDAFRTDRELVDTIVQLISGKLVPKAIEFTDDFHAYEATNNAMDKVKEALSYEEINRIGVWGMGGVGKTTMVRHVAAQACKNGTFNHWTLAIISQNPDIRKIQGTLAYELGLELKEKTEAGRAARLHNGIMRREKLLIILDDVWEYIDLSRIGIPNYKGLQSTNSKIILTTRIGNVCHVMECQTKVVLNTLSVEDSLVLLLRKARRTFESPTFEGVAMKVAEKCGGLPIALIVVARALGDKNIDEWERAAARLEMSEDDNPDYMDNATKCIRLSYDYLKDEDCKSYFLLCCLFPEDIDIYLEDLFMYAIGTGLFKGYETLGEARYRAYSLALHLRSSSLLLDGRDDYHVRFSAAVRWTVIQIAQSTSGFFVKPGYNLRYWPRQIQEDCHAISLMDNQIMWLPEMLVCPNLKILLLKGNYIKRIPESFFQITSKLRVLDLRATPLSSLPQSLSLLTNLHALYLDECEELIIDTSILGKLGKLEILSMRGVALEELSIELGGLINLRIFDNSFGYIGRISPGVVSKWSNLEELYIDGFWDWHYISVEGEEINAGFDEVISLSKLTILEAIIPYPECIPRSVKFIPNWVKLDIRIGTPEILLSAGVDCVEVRSIILVLDNISHLPKWFRHGIIEIANSLHWIGCQRLNDIFIDLEHRGLKHLHMEYLDMPEELEGEIRESFTEVNPTKIPVLKNLEELILTGLNWRESCAAIQTLPHESLIKLKVLKLNECSADDNLLLPLTVLQKLPNLEEFYALGMCSRYLFGKDELFVSLPSKLKKIELFGCGISYMCEGPAPPTMFQNLQSLAIVNCKLEGSLFTHDVAQCLSQLDSLILRECSLLERIVEAGNNKTVLPKLKKLSLTKLPVLYYDSATLDIECPLLNKIDVKSCPKFVVSIFDFQIKNQVQLYGNPFTDRTEKPLLGDIVKSVSTHTVDSEDLQETRQGINELIEVNTDNEVKTFGAHETGGAGKRTMVIQSGASPSSSSVNWKYDVYLSFRGTDSDFFTSTLCDGLKKRGITTFMDVDVQVGGPISISVSNAIEESRFSIIILSPDYAASPWCLEELTNICNKFIEEDSLRIIPVFYNVTSSEARYQKGSFKEAFTNHERSARYGSEKIQQWREALIQVGTLSERHAQDDYKTEINRIEAIVEFMCRKFYKAGFEVFDATRGAMDEVMKALKGEDVSAIGLYGAGGVGKTTMVEDICATVVHEGIFHHVITAVVSKSPDLRELQGTLADMLGLELQEETDMGRSHRLMQKIREGSRILIILDDIWENINLSSIGIPGYHELQRRNSKVLLITRSQNVLFSMGCRSNICLAVLSKQDSLALFMNRARVPFEFIKSSYAASKLARLCAGLPIALIVVAKALGCKDNWEEAAQQLKASRPTNPEEKDIVFTCIKFSYDHLAYDDARSCFLLCCLFPEDYDIQIEDLLKYGMGRGLFQDSNTMQDARARAYSAVRYLRDCSLLSESRWDGCVKMHDVIRDAAIRLSSSEDGGLFFVQAGCQLKKWPSISAPEDYCAISLIRNKICKLPEDFECSNLLVLFMQSNVCLDTIPEKFFQGMSKLRVLDMSQTRIWLLPMSFKFLINLHTLYLDGCLSVIDKISVLGELKGLKILSMRDLPLVELPKEIGNLKNLRMLDITGEYVDMVPSKVIQSLDKLEELYMQCNFADWGSKEASGSKVERSGEQNMASFDELTSLSNLNILKVLISDAKSLPTKVADEPNWESFDICIGRNSSVRRKNLISNASPLCTRALTVSATINSLPVWFTNVVTSKTEKLRYMECPELKNILVEYDCWRLHAVEYLSVNGPSEKLKVLMDTVTLVPTEPVFQNLVELHLLQVDSLKELCVGELPQGSLCNLRLLEVKHCYTLVGALLPSQLLQRLQNLKILICEEIDELEYVFGCEGLKPEHVVLTQLKEMRLKKLGKLTKIWNGPAPCTIFQNLHSLVVSGCFELKSLFTVDVAQSLLQLEYLSVEGCPSLDTVIETNKETMDNQIVIPRLKNLALIRLPRLASFYGNTEGAIECLQLKTLYKERCPRFSASCFCTVELINHQQHLDIVRKSTKTGVVDSNM